MKTRIIGGAAVLALLLAGCTSDDAGETEDGAQAPDAVETTADSSSGDGDTEGGADESGDIGPVDVCGLFDGLDLGALINTSPGALVQNDDDECTVPAADPLEFAQANILLGPAAALPVFRSNYEGDLYDCEVVDVTDIGDGGFTCLGGSASSWVVFVAGEHLVMFSAGNNVAGPPADSLMIDSANQIDASMRS